MFFFFFDDNSNKPNHTNVSEAILSVIKKLPEGVMYNVLIKHPFIAEDFSKDKPFTQLLCLTKFGKDLILKDDLPLLLEKPGNP